MPWEIRNDRPVYLQLMEQVKRKIITGEYLPGAQLPPVRTLAEEAGVNPNTMQKALSELERDGLLFTQRTSGRFVTKDQALIKQIKWDLAKAMTKEFLADITTLGITCDEMKQLLEQEEKAK